MSVAANKYRVLVFDDEKTTCLEAKHQIEALQEEVPIEVDYSLTARHAIESVKKKLYDLVILDLYRGGDLVGAEVYRRLDELGCTTEVLLTTRQRLDPLDRTLLKVFSTVGGPPLVGFFDKRDSSTTIGDEACRRYRLFVKRTLEVENLELVGAILDRRRGRYQRKDLFPLRQNRDELSIEVERLLRELYVEAPPSGSRSVDTKITISPVERRGLSAAVVVNATVFIHPSDSLGPGTGHKTVLKIGPKPDVMEEASRYREFVRYGVELDQRVELLGVSSRDSLGALVYSFAGGLHHGDLLAFDEVLLRDLLTGDTRLSHEIIDNLFHSRHWYDVKGPNIGVQRYFAENYKSDLVRSAAASEVALKALEQTEGSSVQVKYFDKSTRADGHYRLTCGNEQLVIPDDSVLGVGTLMARVPACLVHGDMHAGNVILEVSTSNQQLVKRVCLIDFRNAGLGPRCVDAVALESAVRLADAEAIVRVTGGMGESGLAQAELDEAITLAASRYAKELELYKAIFSESDVELQMEGWVSVASTVLRSMRNNFPDVTLSEYLATSIRYTIRYLGYDVPPVARVRALTWLAAQYELLVTIEGSVDRSRSGQG